jgi:hypothetical protein
MSNAGGFKSLNRYYDMLAGNTTFVDSSFDSIQTVTVGAGGQSTISFTSIPQTYKHLQVRVIARNSGTVSADSNDLSWRCNSDTGSNYARHRLFGTGSATGSSAAVSQSYASSELGIIPSNLYSAGVYAAAIIDVFDYANTSKYKTFRLLGGIDGNTGSTNSRLVFNSNLWQSTVAISQLDFFIGTPTSGDNFLQYSQIALYGIKG